MTKKKNAKTISVVVYFVVGLILMISVGAIVFFTNGLTDDFSTFMLNVNGDYVKNDSYDYLISPTSPLEIKPIDGSKTIKKDECSIDIKANEEIALTYLLNKEEYVVFNNDIDWNAVFDVDYADGKFIITPKADSLERLLSMAYNVDMVAFINPKQAFQKNMFVLVVSVKDQSSINIYFSLDEQALEITFDNREIVF